MDNSGELSVQIRPALKADLETIKEITVEAFDGVSIDQNMENCFGLIHDHDWKWRKARHIDEDVQRDPRGIFVAEMEGAVIGYISTWIDLEAGIGHIPNLAVRSGFRGRGIGRRLMEHALEHFRRHALAYAKIETLAQNPVGYRAYTAMGFEEIARQVHFLKPL